MVALTGVESQTEVSYVPIETMRAVAVLLLVAYHVVGSTYHQGLEIAYPHALRLYADFFLDVRMPLFAFVAGCVYAMRPLKFARYPEFLLGKTQRLIVPGIVATALFLLASNVLGTGFALPWQGSWKAFVSDYAHFWFLQSILVIFVVYGLVDAVLQGCYTLGIFVLAVVAYLAGFRIPFEFFSVNGAVYLFPYFILGVLFLRYGADIWEEAEKLTLLLFVAALVCAFANIRELIETGTFSLDKRDAQSLVFGLSICALACLWCPRLPILERLSPYAFTIYLYHVFGTVAARMAADLAGITATDVRFVWGLAGGLLLPILLHEAMLRIPGAHKLVLGR